MKSVKRALSFLLIVVLFVSFCAVPVSYGASANTPKFQKRIVGYFLASSRSPDAISTTGVSLDDNIEMIDYASLTHLNVSFMNPTDRTSEVPDWKIGDMSDQQVRRIVELCHENKVKCILSVGGGGAGYDYFETEARFKSFYSTLLSYLDDYGFDGLDMDIESSVSKKNYSELLAQVSADLKARGKILSMAVAPYIIEGLGTDAEYFDFFNVMTYDANGTGSTNVAPYDWMITQLDCEAYSTIPKEKMNIGIPFYGYATDGRDAWNCDYDYAKIVQMCLERGNTDFLTQDAILFPSSLNRVQNTDFKVEFNSYETVKRKVEYALESECGGIMIWDVTKDCIRKEDKQYALLPMAAELLKYPSDYEGPTDLLTVKYMNSSLYLEWESPESYPPSGYHIYCNDEMCGTATGTCCLLKKIYKGYDYSFKISAIDPDGIDTAPVLFTCTTPGETALPDLPEWDAETSYKIGDNVIFNNEVWRASRGGKGQQPKNMRGNMWVIDGNVPAVPPTAPVVKNLNPLTQFFVRLFSKKI